MARALGASLAPADALRIDLAHLHAARLDNPQAAIDLLEGIDPEMLRPEEVALASRIATKAREMVARRQRAT